MKKKFTILITAAVMLLTMMARPMTVWGQATDVINNSATASNLGNTGTTSWADNFSITGASGAVYYIHSMGTKNTSNALQWNSNGFLYMTTSSEGNKLKSVTITTTANKNIGIYAQNTAYSAAPSGTALATLAATSSGATYTFESDYTFLALKGTASSTSITNITLEWESASGGDDPTITFSNESLNLGAKALGEEFTTNFTISQSNLSYEITLNADKGTVNPTAIAKDADPTEVTWNYTPTTAGQFDATITATSGTISETMHIYGEAKTLHNVNIAPEIANGSISAEPTQAIEGQYVTLTVTPNDGYELEELTIVDANNTPITVSNINVFQMPDSDVTVSATFEESSAVTVVDYLDRAFTGVAEGATTYSSWSGKTGASGAIYAGNSAGSNNSIQLRTNGSASGFVSTASAGKVTKVEVEWNTNTSSGRKIRIYGKNSAYSAASDLHSTNTATCGTLIGTIDYGSSTAEISINDDYEYIGVRSDNGALYLNWVKITWSTTPSTDPSITAENVNIAYDAAAGEIEYTINNPASGGVLTATTESSWLTIGTVGATVPFTCEVNPAATERAATVTLTYTYNVNEIVTKDVTVTQAGNPDAYMTISEVRAQGTGSVTTKGIVTSCVGTTGYIQDNDAAICVYGSSLTVGDEIRVSGSLTTYNGLLEITSPQVTVVSSGNVVNPEVMTVAEAVASTNQGWYIRIENATVSAISGSNTTIEQGENTIVVRGISGVTLAVNDIISLNGNIGCYNTNQIANPQDITVQQPTEPVITLSSYAINVAADGENGSIEVTFENFTDLEPEIQFFEADGVTPASYTWMAAELDAENEHVTYQVAANDGAARAAYFKVYEGSESVYSNLVTVSQAAYIAPTYAALPFAFNGGRNDIEDTDGLSQEGLGTDYNESTNPTTKLKFDSTGDWVLLQFDERPGTLTFDIKNNSFSGGTFTVQTSEDGATYTDLENYTTITGTQNEEFDNLGENVRYIKWIYTNKSSGNVGLGNIALAQYTVPVPSISADDVAVAYDATSGSIMYTINNYVAGTMVATTEADWISDFTYEQEDEIGEVGFTTTTNASYESRSATVTLTYTYEDSKATASKNVIVTQAAAPIPTYTVSFTVGEGGAFVPNEDFTEDIVEIEAGTYTLPSATKAGFEFAGWNDGTDTYAAGTEYTVSADVDFTAQWTEVIGITYELVESINDIVPDSYYLITSGTDGSVKAMAGQSTNNRSAVAITASNGVITNPEGVVEFVISGSGTELNPYTIYDENYPGYLYAAGTGSSNQLKTQAEINARAQWTITINNNNQAIITALTDETDRKIMRYNSTSGSNGVFSCYGSGQSAIYLFKKVDNSPSITADNVNIEYNETSGSIMYTINNYVEGTMFATTTADWISDFTYEQEDEIGEVGFTTTANELYESRSATVTLTYTYEDSKATATKNVIVTQTAAPTPTYTVSFTVGEGGAFVPNEDFTEDIVEIEAGTYTLPSATKAGFEFAGWNDGNTTYEAGAEYTVSADVEFTATYTELPTYTVSFSVNGTIDDNLTVTGSSITLPTSSTLTPEGFSITGWAATNGSAEAIADPYTPTEDITLYAILRQSIPHSMVINASTANFPSSYASWDEYNLEGKNFMIKQGYINTGKLQWRSASHSSGAGTMYNSDDLGKINTIILVYDSSDSNKNFTIKAGTDANPTEGTSIDPTSDGLVYTFDLSSGNYNYFVMTNGDGAGYLQSISIDYVSDLNVNTITYIETTTTLDTDLPATTCIIVESGAVLTFNGDNNGTVDNLIIEDGGQLIHNAPINATIQRNVKGYNANRDADNSGYMLIASPVSASIDVASTNLINGNYDLYIFNEGQQDNEKEWRNYKANEFTTIDNTKGYLYANESNGTISFAGELKPSINPVTINLDYTDGNRFAGWNLVGNPFACNAYAYDTIGKSLAFFKMNTTGDGFVAVTTGAIAPMEGIFVKASEASQNFAFTKEAPVSNPGKGNLNIQVAQANTGRDAQHISDNAIIRFDGGNNLEKFSFNDNGDKLYFTLGNKDYSVFNAEARGEMPVNFKAAENGTYTIEFSMDNVEFSYLHLIDNKTGMDIDLLQTSSYTFEASRIDYASRFRLVFSAIGNENDSENNDFAFFDANGNLLILGNEGTATLQVIDITGRTVSNETFSGNYSKAINAKAGVYMLRLIQGNDVRTQKIVVR